MILALIVAVVGSLLTWFVYGFQYYDLAQTKRVDNDIYLLEKLLKIIGYYPVLGLTILVFIWSVFWTFKKVSHLPHKVSSYR